MAINSNFMFTPTNPKLASGHILSLDTNSLYPSTYSSPFTNPMKFYSSDRKWYVTPSERLVALQKGGLGQDVERWIEMFEFISSGQLHVKISCRDISFGRNMFDVIVYEDGTDNIAAISENPNMLNGFCWSCGVVNLGEGLSNLFENIGTREYDLCIMRPVAQGGRHVLKGFPKFQTLKELEMRALLKGFRDA